MLYHPLASHLLDYMRSDAPPTSTPDGQPSPFRKLLLSRHGKSQPVSKNRAVFQVLLDRLDPTPDDRIT